MTTMRRPRTSARAHRAAAVAVAALLQVATLLGTAQAAENTTPKTLTEASGQRLIALSAQHSPAGRGYGGHEDNHNDDRNNDDDEDRRDDVLRSVGQLTSSFGSCTATVIDDDSEQLALTAAHCVLGRSGEVAKDVEFVPALAGKKKPYGTWQVTEFWTDPHWTETGKRRYDVAVLRIAQKDGKNIQDVVGGQRFDLRGAAHDDVAVLGYPGEPLPGNEDRFDGKSQERCTTGEIEADEQGLYLTRCRQTGGSSGGPWIRNLDPKTGLGTIVGVTSSATQEFTYLGGVALKDFVRGLIDSAAGRNGNNKSDDADGSR